MKNRTDDLEDCRTFEPGVVDTVADDTMLDRAGNAAPIRLVTREERLAILRGQDLLVDLAVSAEMRRADSPFYTDERLIAWLDREVNSPHRASEGWSREKIRASADRLRVKVEAKRLSVRPVAGSPPVETPAIAGTIPQVLEEARAIGAAPRLDLSAAAGVGRDLWDEPCDQWVRVPDEVPPGRYLAINVTGESMTPLLHTGDTVLVQIGSKVVPDTVVLARLPEAGYVVKRVGKVTRARLELVSLNSAFPPIIVSREQEAIVGTVVLRWCPHGNT